MHGSSIRLALLLIHSTAGSLMHLLFSLLSSLISLPPLTKLRSTCRRISQSTHLGEQRRYVVVYFVIVVASKKRATRHREAPILDEGIYESHVYSKRVQTLSQSFSLLLATKRASDQQVYRTRCVQFDRLVVQRDCQRGTVLKYCQFDCSHFRNHQCNG